MIQRCEQLEVNLKEKGSFDYELKEVISLKDREIEEWGKKYNEMKNLVSEKVSKEGRLQDYEKRIGMLSTELSRLKSMTTAYREEKEQLIQRCEQLEVNLKEKGSFYYELSRLKQLLEAKNNESEECRRKYGEYENKLAVISSELVSINNMLRIRTEEIDSWKKKYMKLEGSMRQFIDADKKLMILNGEIDRLNGIINENRTELDQWRYKYVEYSSLSKKIQLLNKESFF